MSSREETIQALIDQMTPEAIEVSRIGINPKIIVRCSEYPALLPISPDTLTLIHATPNLLSKINSIQPGLTLLQFQDIISDVLLAPRVDGENCPYVLSKSLLLRLIAVEILNATPKLKANRVAPAAKWLWGVALLLIILLIVVWHSYN